MACCDLAIVEAACVFRLHRGQAGDHPGGHLAVRHCQDRHIGRAGAFHDRRALRRGRGAPHRAHPSGRARRGRSRCGRRRRGARVPDRRAGCRGRSQADDPGSRRAAGRLERRAARPDRRPHRGPPRLGRRAGGVGRLPGAAREPVWYAAHRPHGRLQGSGPLRRNARRPRPVR